jgi:lysophospholipase L1-like esterase
MIFARIFALWLAACTALWAGCCWATTRVDKGNESLTLLDSRVPKGDSSNLADRLANALYSAPTLAMDRVSVPPQGVSFDDDRSAMAPGSSRSSERGNIAICETKPRIDEKTGAAAPEGLTILQIGDSHTSADYFTGEVRRVLQAQYGKGGVGYMPAGLPNGFRSAILNITPTKNWTYKSIQRRGANLSEFRFSGYNAIAAEPGETIKIIPNEPLEFDSIEIEATAQPGGGVIDVEVNGQVEARRDLQARAAEPVIIKVTPGAPTALQEISVSTEGKGTVSLASISIYNRVGLTYDSVGYSGATINILNKFDPAQFATALRRINPNVVVLSFGTNESASKTLDLTSYGEKYERVVRHIETVLPDAAIVIIAPPDFNQISSSCKKRADAICREPTVARQPTAAAGNSTASIINSTANNESCVWHTPMKLAQVRDVQQKIAERHRFTYWDWGSIMPAECGAHKWFKSTPQLMSPDHVHFTAAGYRKSADEFLARLTPIIDRIRAGNNVVSHH